MATLKGLKDYIEKVDEEEKVEQKIPWQNKATLKEIPRIPINKPVEKPPLFSSVFKSQEEQQEFLAQFKENGRPLAQEEPHF